MFRQHTSSVRRKTGFDSRTDLLIVGLACSQEATDLCTVGVAGSTPVRSTRQIGLVVQRDDTALAWRKSGFNSRRVHLLTEGSRIRLAEPVC